MMRLALLMLMILPQLCCGLWRGQVVGIASAPADRVVHGHQRGDQLAHEHRHHHGDHHHHGHHHGPHRASHHEHGLAALIVTDGHGTDEHPVPDHQHIDADDARASRSSWALEHGSVIVSLVPPVAVLERDERVVGCYGSFARCADPGGGRATAALQAWRTVRLQV